MNELKRNTWLEKGQSLVEFAISVVVLLILLVGIVDLGRALFAYMTLRDAAQEGALYGSLYPTDAAGIEAHVRNASDAMLGFGPTNVQVQVTFPDGGQCNGKGIRILVTYQNFPLTMPFLGTLIGSQTIPISASVTDTILLPPC